MKLKHIIGDILIALGLLAVFGAIGHLDYLDDHGERYGAAEIKEMIVRSLAGLAAVGAGAFLCRDIEAESDEAKPLNEKENRAD